MNTPAFETSCGIPHSVVRLPCKHSNKFQILETIIFWLLTKCAISIDAENPFQRWRWYCCLASLCNEIQEKRHRKISKILYLSKRGKIIRNLFMLCYKDDDDDDDDEVHYALLRWNVFSFLLKNKTKAVKIHRNRVQFLQTYKEPHQTWGSFVERQ